jgi:parallel beta-helix repeat protein
MGGGNSDQMIQHIHTHDTRSWSCLHVAEGSLNCNNVTVQNIQSGPCGHDESGQWADGMSISCQNAIVRNNIVTGATDGGCVIFGSPGTQVYNNTIIVGNVICFVSLDVFFLILF